MDCLRILNFQIFALRVEHWAGNKNVYINLKYVTENEEIIARSQLSCLYTISNIMKQSRKSLPSKINELKFVQKRFRKILKS